MSTQLITLFVRLPQIDGHQIEFSKVHAAVVHHDIELLGQLVIEEDRETFHRKIVGKLEKG